MKMFQVDAFTNRLFAGNPAAVLVLEDWLDDELMLAVAEENSLAFSPSFCGHSVKALQEPLCPQ